MMRTHTLIVGAGQAGLALSRCLTARGIEHVVLERGRVAEGWTARWDSLRLLTPNWMTRLPDWRYTGTEPDGFMHRDDVVAFLEAYARSCAAPVREHTAVHRVAPSADGWRVTTDAGTWASKNVVIATGHCQFTRLPRLSEAIPAGITQTTVSGYRNPSQLPDGGVLVVGASASGIQLADEIARSGRPVVLAVGRHTRLPRRYRGRDILYWLDRMGSLAKPVSSLPAPEEGRHEPSMQLVGSDPPVTLDLDVLAGKGVRLAGRLTGFDGPRARFAADLARTTADADARLERLLDRIDHHIRTHGTAEAFIGAPHRPAAVAIRAEDCVDLRKAGIRTVLWATGYGRSYSWLSAPVFDETGEIRQVRGRTAAPGLYAIGLQFMIRRNSSFIDGVGADAVEIADDIARRAAHRRLEAA